MAFLLVRLEGTNSSGALPVIESAFSVRNTPKDQAEEFYHPVDFDLPSEYRDNVTITLTLDPDNSTIDSNRANNTYTKTLNYVQAPTLKIRFIPVKVSGANNTALELITSETDNKTLNSLIDYHRAMYPNAIIDAAFVTEKTITTDNISLALSDVEAHRQQLINYGGDNDSYYYGLWTGGLASFPGGIAGLADRPSSVDYISDVGWSGIGVVFEQYILSTTAHELGHMTSLPHIECNNRDQ